MAVHLFGKRTQKLHVGDRQRAPTLVATSLMLDADGAGVVLTNGSVHVSCIALRRSAYYDIAPGEFVYVSADGLFRIENDVLIQTGRLVQDGDTTGTLISRVANVDPIPTTVLVADEAVE